MARNRLLKLAEILSSGGLSLLQKESEPMTTDDAAALKAQGVRKTYDIPARTITTVYDRHGPVTHDPPCCDLCIRFAIRDAVADARRDAAEMVKGQSDHYRKLKAVPGDAKSVPFALGQEDALKLVCGQLDDLAARIAGAAPAAKEDGR